MRGICPVREAANGKKSEREIDEWVFDYDPMCRPGQNALPLPVCHRESELIPRGKSPSADG